MKRIIAVLLTLMMALSLTACSGDDNAQVAGTWKWNCDMTEMFQEGVNQGAGMDLATDAWSPAILAAAGLDGRLLPAIEPATSAWPVDAAVARRLGLAPGAQVILGAMDNCCAFLGAMDPAEARLANVAGTYEHMAGVGPGPVARAAAVAVNGLVHRFPPGGRDLSCSRIPVGLMLGEIATAAGPGGLARLWGGVA